MDVPWWRRKHANPLAPKKLLGQFLLIFGVMMLFGAFGGPPLVVGALVSAVGLFLGGDGLWWRTGARDE